MVMLPVLCTMRCCLPSLIHDYKQMSSDIRMAGWNSSFLFQSSLRFLSRNNLVRSRFFIIVQKRAVCFQTALLLPVSFFPGLWNGLFRLLDVPAAALQHWILPFFCSVFC